MSNKFLLYIDIATNIDDTASDLEYNSIRKEQIINGISKVLKYDFKKYGCDIAISDNTCTELIPAIKNILPNDTIISVFDNNPIGWFNKGAGVLQKWEYNKDIFSKYEWIIHFEGRLLMKDYTFFDNFFSKPDTYFAYGNPLDKTNTNGFFTGLFSARSKDIIAFFSIYKPHIILFTGLSIENVIRDYFVEKAQIVNNLFLYWFPSKENRVVIY